MPLAGISCGAWKPRLGPGKFLIKCKTVFVFFRALNHSFAPPDPFVPEVTVPTPTYLGPSRGCKMAGGPRTILRECVLPVSALPVSLLVVR